MKRRHPHGSLRVGLHGSAMDIPAEQWNSLITEGDVPFLEWEWFAALEGSGSVSSQTGWQPIHVTLWDGKTLVGLAPLYAKVHSWGEFVFDHLWAEAAHQLGRPYYPKLVGVIPATPVVGYRFLIAPGYDPAEIRNILLEVAESLCRDCGLQGIHILFAHPSEGPFYKAQGLTPWKHHHYLWKNEDFQSFNHYLGSFNKNQRKNIRKERQNVGASGIDLRVVPAIEADPAYFTHMYRLYSRTNDKFAPYDARYVNESFFHMAAKHFARRIVWVEASSPTHAPLALSLLVRKGRNLWGRYWGCYQDHKDLHFEACYYAPIQYAIEQGIETFDPGAGSPHKVRRGFVAKPHFSYHRFFDPLLDHVFRANIERINEMEELTIEELNSASPLKVRP